MIGNYNEDKLVQKTMADYLEQELGWRSVYAYNQEDFGEQFAGPRFRSRGCSQKNAAGKTCRAES